MDHSPFRSWKRPCFRMNTLNRKLGPRQLKQQCYRKAFSVGGAQQFLQTVAFAVAHARTETVGAVVCLASLAHLTGTMGKISVPLRFSRSDGHSSSTGPAHVASHARRARHQHCQSRQYRRRHNHIRLGNYGGLPPRCLAIHWCSRQARR